MFTLTRSYKSSSSIWNLLRRQISNIRLDVEPGKICLVDEELSIKVSGLSPHQMATIGVSVTENKMEFASHAWFTADANGSIDVKKMASSGGSYSGTEPMGLFSSIKQTPGQRPGLRLKKKDVTTPFCTKISVFETHTYLQDIKSNSESCVLCEMEIERYFMAKNVSRYEITQGRLRGALFVPKESVPLPGILDLSGTGGRDEERAALLANKGYVVFHLVYFGEGKLSPLWDIDLDYFDEVLDFMNSQPSVQSDNIAMVGMSTGGELCLLFSSVTNRLKAAVAISAFPYVTYFPHKYNAKGQTYPAIEFDPTKIEVDENNGFSFVKCIAEKSLETRIKLEKCQAPVLIIQGADDRNNPPTAEEDVELMEKEFGPLTTKVITYKGAGHFIEPPYGPFYDRLYHKVAKSLNVFGGTQEAQSKANEHSWKIVQEFLRKHLCSTSR